MVPPPTAGGVQEADWGDKFLRGGDAQNGFFGRSWPQGHVPYWFGRMALSSDRGSKGGVWPESAVDDVGGAEGSG